MPSCGQRLPTTFAVVWLTALVLAGSVSAQASQTTKAARALTNLQTQHRDAHRRFGDALERIAQRCEERGLDEIPAQIRRMAKPVDPDVLRFEPLPRSIQPPIPADLPDEELQWRMQLREQRKDYAQKLDLLAQNAVKAGHPSYAFQLIREAASHDTDHARARRLLGFVRHKDEWVSAFEKLKLEKNEVWTDQFGWLPAAHVARYERGERLFEGRWISAEKEAALRQDFRKGWDIRTEHYLLRTNHSLERGVALASALEEFQRFFHQTFAAFFDNPAQIQKLFANATVPGRALGKPFEVHFYRSRDEYIARLVGMDKYKREIVEISNGVYDTDDRVVYTFQSPAQSAETTLYHEATHQMLAAHLKPSPVIADRANFWLIEGIACYIESYQKQNGQVSLGDPKFLRFETARHRFLVDQYYLPLSEFTKMGKDAFQAHPHIQNNYSQAAGLVHFFMHDHGGRYRDNLIEHLRQLYAQAERSRDPVETLAELSGVDFQELDQQYADYVRTLSQSLGEDFAPAK
ncbi:MAG TPA: hypothetical protein VK137_09680 [Planctomycetaceae bacterium]|nr:hypothetical protein [Planctomycetaceae bacterium]